MVPVGVLSAALVLVPAAALAHARLTSPTPRSPSSAIKSGPCGTAPRTAPTVFAPKERITVSWEETVNHPGHYRIAFSPADDLGFDQNVLADNLPNPAGIQSGQTEVTLPDVTCEGCSLQLVQVMTDSNPPSYYYSCADLALRAPPPDGGQDAGQGAEDAGTPDAGLADAGATPPDAGAAPGPVADPDAGLAPPEALGPVSGGCSATGATALFALAALSCLLRRRRHPR